MKQYNGYVPPCGVFCGGCPMYKNGRKSSCDGAETGCKNRNCKSFYQCCIKIKELNYCHECKTFPCAKFKNLAKSWIKYGEDLINNQQIIKEKGIEFFLEEYNKKSDKITIMDTTKQLLRDADIFPDKDVLKNALGSSYNFFDSFIDKITSSEYGLELQWNYYKDGKAWLGKVVFKKKTVFWLSVWEDYFMTSFFFTEKTGTHIAGLDIDNKIKENFNASKMVGKLKPLIIEVFEEGQLNNLYKIIEYKKSIK